MAKINTSTDPNASSMDHQPAPEQHPVEPTPVPPVKVPAYSSAFAGPAVPLMTGGLSFNFHGLQNGVEYKGGYSLEPHFRIQRQFWSVFHPFIELSALLGVTEVNYQSKAPSGNISDHTAFLVDFGPAASVGIAAQLSGLWLEVGYQASIRCKGGHFHNENSDNGWGGFCSDVHGILARAAIRTSAIHNLAPDISTFIKLNFERDRGNLIGSDFSGRDDNTQMFLAGVAGGVQKEVIAGVRIDFGKGTRYVPTIPDRTYTTRQQEDEKRKNENKPGFWDKKGKQEEAKKTDEQKAVDEKTRTDQNEFENLVNQAIQAFDRLAAENKRCAEEQTPSSEFPRLFKEFNEAFQAAKKFYEDPQHNVTLRNNVPKHVFDAYMNLYHDLVPKAHAFSNQCQVIENPDNPQNPASNDPATNNPDGNNPDTNNPANTNNRNGGTNTKGATPDPKTTTAKKPNPVGNQKKKEPPIKPQPTANKNSDPYKWCEDISKRCEQINQTVASKPNFSAYSNPAEKLSALLQSQKLCTTLVTSCKDSPPILNPKEAIDPDKKTEMGSLHDVPAFYELSNQVMPYLQGAQKLSSLKGSTVNILYPASGYHASLVEFAGQILRKTNYQKVNITMTEIDPEWLENLIKELKGLEHNSLRVEKGPTLQKETSTHQEHIIRMSLTTPSGARKEIIINYVIGKKQPDGNYPPLFRQQDFDKANIVLVYDASSVDFVTNSIDKADKEHQGKGDKLLIIEDRKNYVQWATKKGYKPTGTGTSQHFGCGDQFQNKENAGLGLGAAIFKMQFPIKLSLN